jgi:ElaB/YqjD/DUF883 family membrane-anchored ribosome-binding protein
MQTKSNFSQPSSMDRIVEALPNGSVGAIASDTTNEFHNFVADMEDLVGSATSVTGDELVRVKAKLSARVALAKRSIQDMSDVVVKTARKSAADTDTYVRANPWQAIGVGAVAGVLLGFVLGRRK